MGGKQEWSGTFSLNLLEFTFKDESIYWIRVQRNVITSKGNTQFDLPYSSEINFYVKNV